MLVECYQSRQRQQTRSTPERRLVVEGRRWKTKADLYEYQTKSIHSTVNTMEHAVFSVAVTRSGYADEPLRLRVLSYNIHHAEGVDGRLDVERIAGVIRSVSPDLVALQEVEQNTRRTKMVDQTAELGRLTNMKSLFAKNIDFQGGGYGNAVLSRFPIKASRNLTLPNHDQGEQRGAVFVDLEIEGRDELLTFICTHLDHRPNESERLASADAIRQEINSMESRPMILAGDLNATPESAVLISFRKDWMISNDDPLPTIPVDKPKRQIDYVLVRPAQRWKVIETRVLDEAIASDHRAIFSVLELHSPDR